MEVEGNKRSYNKENRNSSNRDKKFNSNKNKEKTYNKNWRDGKRDDSPAPFSSREKEKLFAAVQRILQGSRNGFKNKTGNECFVCGKAGHGWRNCYLLKNWIRVMRNMNEAQKPSKDSDSDEEKGYDDDEDDDEAFSAQELTYDDLLMFLNSMNVDVESLLNE